MADGDATFSNIRPLGGGSIPSATPASDGSGAGATFSNIRPIGGATQTSDTTSQTQPTSEPLNTGHPVLDFAGDVMSGIGGGIMEFGQGAKNIVNKALPKSAQIPDIPQEYREERNTGEKIGGALEQVGEFFAGDAALEGLAKASRMVELAQKSPIIAKTLELAKEHPVLEKLITGGAKGATIGGAQGAVKGAAEGDAAAEAKGGALGGALAGPMEATIEAATPIAKELASKFGIGASAEAEAIRGMRPGKRNIKFATNFARSAPYLDAENAVSPAKSVEDWADHAENARNKLYQNKIDPIVQQHATEPLGGLNIADNIRSTIPPAMKQFAPEEAAKMEEVANKFIPGSVFHIQMQDAEQALQHYNAELAATGFWSKPASERAGLLKTNGYIAGLKATGDAIRDEFYGRLEQLSPGSNMAELKKDYGALREIEDQIRGRVNITEGHVPLSLKETIGLITGHPVGMAVPIADKLINAPKRQIARAVQKAARPGEEGAVSKAITGTGKAMAEHGGTTTGMAGAEIGRIVFQSSDGETHSIPDNEHALAHAKFIDPGLKIVSQ